MERVNYGNVAPEIAVLFASMQRQIDDCNARAAAAETRAAAAERLVQEKDAEIARLKNTIHTYQRMLFGSRSEKTRYLNDFEQLNMFGPEDELSDEGLPGEGTIPIAGHTRKAKKQWSSFIDEMIESGRYPVEDEIIDLPEPERIDKDGKPLEYIGTELVRRMLKTTRQEYRVQRVFRKVYGSSRDKETLKRETVVGGEVPPGVIPHSPASSSVIADIVTKKYLYSEPLYRQERQFHDVGIMLDRNTLASWVILSSAYIEKIWDHFKKALLTQSVIHADETVLQVLHNSKGNPRAKSRMWVYTSGKMSPIRIACFEYQDTRAGQAAVNFLEGFQGCVVSDGYSGYSKVKDLTRGGCWAHTRRKWYEALPGELRVKDSKNDSVVKQPDPTLECDALRALCLVNELFRLEREYAKANLTPAQRLEKRTAEAKPILDKYWALVDSIQNPNGKLHDAWTYSQRQRPYLMAFIENGELEISNNQAENVIRNLVVGRKNWLFCDSQDGARATALYYSLMVTAQINRLRVYDYVQYVLDTMSGAIYGRQTRNTSEMDALLDEMMPWSTLMQEKFEAPWLQELKAN